MLGQSHSPYRRSPSCIVISISRLVPDWRADGTSMSEFIRALANSSEKSRSLLSGPGVAPQVGYRLGLGLGVKL